MFSTTLYAIGSVLLVSLMSVIGAIPLLIKKTISQRTLLLLVSLSAGSLFGGAFLHLIPESVSQGYTLGVGLSILLGIGVFFIIEKFVHYKHQHHEAPKSQKLHAHAYHIAPMNIIGDGVHNFIDGVVIAASYLVSIPLGIAATVSVLLHELPQEIADFGVLLYAGMSKTKALFFNFFSAAMAIIGAIVGLVLSSKLSGFTQFILPFAAGNFIYIAGSNLVPELHKHCSFKESLLHVIMILLGVGIMVALIFFGPAHVH